MYTSVSLRFFSMRLQDANNVDDELKCPKTRSVTIWKSKPKSQYCSLVSVLGFLVLVTIISKNYVFKRYNCRSRKTRLICWQLSWKQDDHDQSICHWNSFHCKAFVLVTNGALSFTVVPFDLSLKNLTHSLFSSAPTKTTKESLSAKDVNLKEVSVRTFSLCVTTMVACDQCMIWLHVVTAVWVSGIVKIPLTPSVAIIVLGHHLLIGCPTQTKVLSTDRRFPFLSCKSYSLGWSQWPWNLLQ